jgi:hypothetical protein
MNTKKLNLEKINVEFRCSILARNYKTGFYKSDIRPFWYFRSEMGWYMSIESKECVI